MCVKTTVELPDDLLIEAKKRAAEFRVPLRKLLEEGLRARLARPPTRKRGRKRSIRWITVDGGLPPGMDLSDREKMHALMGVETPDHRNLQGGFAPHL